MPLKMIEEKKQESFTKISNVIAIAAGKGGVGKSTVTANLARALKCAGYAVGVADMDIYGPSLRLMIPEEQMPLQKGEKIFPAICEGIRMISMAYFRKKDEAAAVRAPVANSVVNQFLQNIEWGHLDFLLIDFPPGTGDIQLTLSQKANLSGAIMVTTPQEVAVMDVRRAIALFNQVRVPIIGIVENMSYYLDLGSKEKLYLFGRDGGRRLSEEIGVPFLGGIPIDPEISRSCDEGRSLFSKSGEGLSAEAFTRIAETFLVHISSLKRFNEEGIPSFEIEWKEMG